MFAVVASNAEATTQTNNLLHSHTQVVAKALF